MTVVNSNVQDSTLRRLLKDSIFIDFFNKFMCIPIFPIKCLWKDSTFYTFPELDQSHEAFDHEQVQAKIFDWILQERLPFFFQSPIYIEYQLCKLLTSALLFDEDHSDLIGIQRQFLSSMASMYKFKRWLKQWSFIGVLSLTYWVDAQAALVVHYRGNNDEDAQMLFLEIKDKYYEKHSQFCLPEPILVHQSSQISKTSAEYTITVQAKVLRHLQYYYMPEFLLAHKHELIDCRGDSKEERDKEFLMTLRTFVNRSFQNCNLVYSMNSKTQLLQARRVNSATSRERFSTEVKESPFITESPFISVNEDHPERTSLQSASVTVKASDIMVVYHMEYKGQLATDDHMEPIVEDFDNCSYNMVQGRDSEATGTSPERLSTDQGSGSQTQQVGFNIPGEHPPPRRSKMVVNSDPRTPSSVGLNTGNRNSMIYQSRSLFARGSAMQQQLAQQSITENIMGTMPHKRSILDTKKMLQDSEIHQRKASQLAMPYNTTRKQSMVQRKMSRKMTLRRGTLHRGAASTLGDGMGGPSVRPSQMNHANLPTLETTSESKISEDGSTGSLTANGEQGQVGPASFIKTIKNRMAVAKAVRKLKVRSSCSRRTGGTAHIEKTVRMHFRMNDSGTELKAKAVSSNTRFSQTEFAVKKSAFNDFEAPEQIREESRTSQLIKPESSTVIEEGSQPTMKNPMALFKLKGMAKRARQKALGKESQAQFPVKSIMKPIRKASLAESVKSEAQETEDVKNASLLSVAQDDEPEGAGRRRGRGMSLSIYSTASNSNQRGAKCTKTNLKMPKLQAIDDANDEDMESGDEQERLSLGSYENLADAGPREDVGLGPTSTSRKKRPKKMTFLAGSSEEIKGSRGKRKGRKGSALGKDISPVGSMHRKQSLASVKSALSDMAQKKARTKSCFGRHMVEKIEIEKRFQKYDVKKIMIDDSDVSNINENIVRKMAMDEMIMLQRRSYSQIQALLSDRLSGGIFYQYLTKSASFDMRSILCLCFIQDLQMFEDCFPLLDRLQVSAAFEAILLKNVPTALTILNELPGIRSHWNYLLGELREDNNWQQIPWRLYAIKVDAIKLLLVEHTRFIKQARLFFLTRANEVPDDEAEAGTVLSSVAMYQAPSATSTQLNHQAGICNSQQFASGLKGNIDAINTNLPPSLRFRKRYEVVWRERPSDEPDSDMDSDEEESRHNAGIEKLKRAAIREQFLSSLPIGTRQRFRGKRVTDHHVFAQMVYFFGKNITLSCFSILSTDDEIPHVLLQQEKAFLNHQPLPTNQLAMHSLIQYPNKDDPDNNGGVDGMGGVSARIVEKQKHKPMYMCSIRKNGHVLRRPEKRPANFLEVLRDPRHYEFFARYLKAMNCEGPLMFWKSVEHLKSIPEAAKRQIKIKAILKKYFAWSPNQTRTIVRLAATINLLNCNADIIRDIIDLDIESVNVSLLVAAQTAVQRSMEKAWEVRYYKTFPDADQDEPTSRITRRIQDMSLDTNDVDDKLVQPSSNAWRVFTLFIKRSAMFIKAMKMPQLQEEFRQYLKNYAHKRRSVAQRALLANAAGNVEKYALSVDHREKEMAYEIPSRASSVCKIYPYHLYDPDDANMNLMSMKFEMVCGKNVYPDLLVNDLDFWLEVQLYQEMIDSWQKRQEHVYTKVCNKHIKDKVHLITTVYLHSHIPPKVRVNADHELARAIQMYSLNLSNGVSNIGRGYKEIDRSIFHEVVLQIFPVLIKHWSAFCHNKFRYVSKQNIARRRQQEAQVKHNQLTARRQREKVRLLKKHHTPGASNYPTPSTTAATTHSGYGDALPRTGKLKIMRNVRVENCLMIDNPILKFSVSGGEATWMTPAIAQRCSIGNNSFVSMRSHESARRASRAPTRGGK